MVWWRHGCHICDARGEEDDPTPTRGSDRGAVTSGRTSAETCKLEMEQLRLGVCWLTPNACRLL